MVCTLDIPKKPWNVEEGIDFDLERWKIKRKWTARAFVLQCLMLGMEYSVTFLTLWLYIKTLIDTPYPTVFYSLISASYLLACVLVSVLVGRWVDQTRKVRQTFLVCNTLVIIGNIVYSLNFSPWLLVVGRLVSGFDGPLRSIISGEVARCYPAEDVLGKFSIMGMAFSLGFIMGPGVNFMFTSVDFVIGEWHVTYVNIPGLYMAVLFAFTQICVYFMVFDLSREHDLKKNETNEILTMPITEVKISYFEIEKTSAPLKETTDGDLENSLMLPMSKLELSSSVNYGSLDETSINMPAPEKASYTKEHSGSTRRKKRNIALKKLELSGLYSQSFDASDCFSSTSMLVLFRNQQTEKLPLIESESGEEVLAVGTIAWKLCSNIDTVLVMLLTFFLWYWMVAFDMWLPLLVVDVMGMGINELNGIVFGFGCISAIILFTLSYKTFSDKTIFSFGLISMAALAIMEIIFIVFKFYHSNLAINVILWVTWGTLFAIVVVMDEVFLVGALSKMVSSDIQTFSESVRLAMSRFGALIALLTSAMLFQWLEYVCCFAVIFALISLMLLLWRRKTLTEPKIMIR